VSVIVPLLLGYWRMWFPAQPWPGETEEQWAGQREKALSWPDPHDFVDHTWSKRERKLVANYLERGTLVNTYRGLSQCRFCKQKNGSGELTDGAFCWPEGLGHYLWEHDVRLPQEFITHVHSSPFRLRNAPRPTFPRWGERDRAWPGPEFADLLWAPDEPTNPYGLFFEPDPTWWLHQTGMSEGAQ
jgi:hypothetical protein